MTRFLSPRELTQALLDGLHRRYGAKQQLARLMATSDTQVDRLLSGTCNPRWSTLQKAAAALGKLEGQEYTLRLVVEPTRPEKP